MVNCIDKYTIIRLKERGESSLQIAKKLESVQKYLNRFQRLYVNIDYVKHFSHYSP